MKTPSFTCTGRACEDVAKNTALVAKVANTDVAAVRASFEYMEERFISILLICC
jgi:hypothetical protein